MSHYVQFPMNESFSNMDKPRWFMDSDIFFCESPFLAEEEARGQERFHLTSRQAGIIAREAEVKKLNVFHFSGRHTFRTEQLIQEADEAFRG